MPTSKSLTLLIATTNRNKLKEFRRMLRTFPQLKIISLKQFPNAATVRETGKTFEENAKKKALGYARHSHVLTLAEDSGLCVDVLGGKPGIHSARFAGRNSNDINNCKKLLRSLKKIPHQKRSARYECVIAVAERNKIIGLAKGRVCGLIASEMRGRNGFGYDPLFFYPPFKKTFAEVSADKKNKVSHRFRALEKTQTIIAKYLSSL